MKLTMLWIFMTIGAFSYLPASWGVESTPIKATRVQDWNRSLRTDAVTLEIPLVKFSLRLRSKISVSQWSARLIIGCASLSHNYPGQCIPVVRTYPVETNGTVSIPAQEIRAAFGGCPFYYDLRPSADLLFVGPKGQLAHIGSLTLGMSYLDWTIFDMPPVNIPVMISGNRTFDAYLKERQFSRIDAHALPVFARTEPSKSRFRFPTTESAYELERGTEFRATTLFACDSKTSWQGRGTKGQASLWIDGTTCFVPTERIDTPEPSFALSFTGVGIPPFNDSTFDTRDPLKPIADTCPPEYTPRESPRADLRSRRFQCLPLSKFEAGVWPVKIQL